MYKATQGQPGAGPQQPGDDGSQQQGGGQQGAGNAGENVTDAEFEEVK